MGVALSHQWWVSPEEYLEGENLAGTKHEYVGGIVYAMAGAKNRHNQIVVNILVELGSQLRGRICQPFNSDTKVRVRHGSDVRFYDPDAMVVCDPNGPDEAFQDHPVVIFEVLSESTARADRVENCAPTRRSLPCASTPSRKANAWASPVTTVRTPAPLGRPSGSNNVTPIFPCLPPAARCPSRRFSPAAVFDPFRDPARTTGI